MNTNKAKETITEISISELRPFKGHPYRVVDDEEMDRLVESIEEHGIMTPINVRPIEGGYEVISGHRRIHAAKRAGLATIPAIEMDMTRDQAAVALVDSNLHREKLLPSEKAFAYKLKLEALSRQPGRPSKNVSQVGTQKRTDQIMAEEAGESRNQIQRYIRLTNLIPPLLRMVDEERIAFTPAVELSYLSQEEQEMLFTEIGVTLATPSLSQACRLKKLSGEGKLDEDAIAEIMAEEKPNQKERVSVPLSALKGKVPDSYTDRQLQEYVIKAVDHYHRYLTRQREVR
ncbi:MAG: ParB/RepB/Spo0J family partition protein [Clostridiales bacterium]|nr:ParB/RepB/Spo0J family partition protein [Clostridiales bacterium]